MKRADCVVYGFIQFCVLFGVLMFGPRVQGADGSEPLPNLIKVSKTVFSGAQPHEKWGYPELKKMGINTIVSVDGATPAVEIAKSLGMDYVHIPIGYDGISAKQAATLKSVLSKKEAPFYIHCHHGKHRGPSAASVLLIRAGVISKDQALSFVQQAGLSPHYKGLWKAIEDAATQLNDETKPLPLVSQAVVSDYTQAMVEIDEVYHHLKDFAKNKWQPLPESPDLTAEHSALMLWEKLKELPRTTKYEFSHEDVYTAALEANTKAAKELHTVLQTASFGNANTAMKQLKESCIDCHSEYRD